MDNEKLAKAIEDENEGFWDSVQNARAYPGGESGQAHSSIAIGHAIRWSALMLIREMRGR